MEFQDSLLYNTQYAAKLASFNKIFNLSIHGLLLTHRR